MLRRLAALPLLCTVVACSEGQDVCASQERTYRIHGRVSLLEPAKSAGDGSAGQIDPESASVLASVTRSTDIVSCAEGLVSERTPGATLVSARPLALDEQGFALELTETVYPELAPPTLWLHLLMDENGNGVCDDGELQGGLELQRSSTAAVEINLSAAACPGLRL